MWASIVPQIITFPLAHTRYPHMNRFGCVRYIDQRHIYSTKINQLFFLDKSFYEGGVVEISITWIMPLCFIHQW